MRATRSPRIVRMGGEGQGNLGLFLFYCSAGSGALIAAFLVGRVEVKINAAHRQRAAIHLA